MKNGNDPFAAGKLVAISKVSGNAVGYHKAMIIGVHIPDETSAVKTTTMDMTGATTTVEGSYDNKLPRYDVKFCDGRKSTAVVPSMAIHDVSVLKNQPKST